MSINKLIRSVILTGIIAAGTSSAIAGPLYELPGGTDRSNADGTVGLRFVPSVNLLVTHLGYFDKNGDGLTNAHQVGLWGTSTTALGTVTIQTLTTSPLTDQYRYEPLTTPILLLAGQTYILGAEIFNTPGVDVWPDLSGTFTTLLPVVTSPPAMAIGGQYIQPLFAKPTSPTGDGSFYQAPNLIATVVPEPGTFALISIGLIGMVRVIRRRHSCRGLLMVAAFVLVGAAQPCLAAAVPLLSSVTGGTVTTYNSGVVGYAFTYTGNTGDTVTSLGILNANSSGGLQENHTVDLWSEAALNSGTPTPATALASVTVLAGTGTPGQFSYVALGSPFALTNGGHYVLGASTGSALDPYRDNAVVVSSLATIHNGRFVLTPSGFPSSAGNLDYTGPNMLINQVPEPNTFVLIGLALIGILRTVRRHR